MGSCCEVSMVGYICFFTVGGQHKYKREERFRVVYICLGSCSCGRDMKMLFTEIKRDSRASPNP